MASDSNALPWFPLTPDYIDKYHDSVIKYLRDNYESAKDDKSFITTMELLSQRSQEIYNEFAGRSLYDSESIDAEALLKFAKIIASQLILDVMTGNGNAGQRLVLLSYLTTLIQPDRAEEMSALILNAIRSDGVKELAYDFDDIIEMDSREFSQKLSGTVLEKSDKTWWFEEHGSVKIDPQGLFIYDMNRHFIDVKSKMGGAFRKEQGSSDSQTWFMMDKKDKHEFCLTRFLEDIKDVEPSEGQEVKKRVYAEGDELTVRVNSCGYDVIYVESTDPSYETLSGKIQSNQGYNIRGLYMTDIVRNLHPGDLLNVVYEGERAFSIEESIMSFIREEYWDNDEVEQKYSRMNAILLFPKHGNVMNTWLSEYGFLVRSGYEDLPKYAFRTLEITGYNYDMDWFSDCEVLDEDPDGEPFDEVEAKNGFLQYMFFSQKQIISPELPKVEVNLIEPSLMSFYHRTSAMKDQFTRSEDMEGYFSTCAALAAVAGDSRDLDYYRIRLDYISNLISFASNRIKDIKAIDRNGIEKEETLEMSIMSDVLSVYGEEGESAFLSEIIQKCADSELAVVAKLVQAANRFQGSQFLEKMRGSIHREICAILDVADAIVVPESEKDENFPFEPEGNLIEHKMSWVFDNQTHQFNETTQSNKIMKTVCAFLNNMYEDGVGHVYIGTDEARHYVCGFQNDLDALVAKGDLMNTGDIKDEYLRHISAIIKSKFPETYHKVKATLIHDSQVIDLEVSPADVGVVYFNGIAYERYNSSSRPMREDKKESIINRKYIRHIDMAEKIEAVRKAIHLGQYAVLKAYNSSSSNTDDDDRKLEVFAFTNDDRRDGVWALDPDDKRCKVFLLKRTSKIEVRDEKWKYEKLHKVYDLDAFGFSGDQRIPVNIVLKSVMVRNILIEQHPDTRPFITEIGDKMWRLETILYHQYSLEAAGSFYLGYADDLDISESPELKSIVSRKLNSLLEKM